MAALQAAMAYAESCRRAYLVLTAAYGATGKWRQSEREMSNNFRLVPLAGLEPAQCCHYLILSQVSEISWLFP
jgi:hypothetical protein